MQNQDFDLRIFSDLLNTGKYFGKSPSAYGFLSVVAHTHNMFADDEAPCDASATGTIRITCVPAPGFRLSPATTGSQRVRLRLATRNAAVVLHGTYLHDLALEYHHT